MNLELCDLCHKKEPNRRFKIKMSTKGYYRETGYGVGLCDLWKPYEKICVCEDCAEKLFGIKSTKTRLKEMTDMLQATTVTVKKGE